MSRSWICWIPSCQRNIESGSVDDGRYGMESISYHNVSPLSHVRGCCATAIGCLSHCQKYNIVENRTTDINTIKYLKTQSLKNLLQNSYRLHGVDCIEMISIIGQQGIQKINPLMAIQAHLGQITHITLQHIAENKGILL